MSSTIRTFVALPISRETAAALHEIQARLVPAGMRVKWVQPSHFHITLKFLGDIEASEVPRLRNILVRTISMRGGFSLTFQGVGVFPNWKKPKVIWSAVNAGRGELEELALAVRSGADEILAEGKDPFSAHTPVFRPHVTLGRVKENRPKIDLRTFAEPLQALQAGPDYMECVVIYSSRLTPKGPIYTPLETIPLEGRALE